MNSHIQTPTGITAMLKRTAAIVALSLALTGCDSLLDENPVDELPEDVAITTPEGARAALAGAYNALQEDSYYGGDFYLFGDLSSENSIHIGTSNSYADADANTLLSDNPVIEAIWVSIYRAIHRTNVLIQKVPGVPGMDPAERDQILGEAYFLRALHYHNLAKVFGGVPLRLEPPASVEEASQIARSTAVETYAQIHSDLAQAEALISSTSPATQATLGAVRALQARVYFYQGDWANAVARVDAVTADGFDLEGTFSNLFDAEGTDTPEDIFKVTFTAVQYQYMYYWISCSVGGGCEQAPSQILIDAFDDPYDNTNTDARLTWSISGTTEPDAWGTKFPSTAGAEDIHAIRYAELVLIKAEALAQQSQLSPAVDEINRIRARAGLNTITLGVEVTTQQDVLNEIDRQRLLELAFEGDRWPDLVRRGAAETVLGIPTFQTLYPIPLSEIDVAPNIVQNPGY
jgi:starch-binding outer membrane protein, SusD/RagB family